ncbi:MAG: hypothetical protein WC100_17065 [Sterolibacterium sp.]
MSKKRKPASATWDCLPVMGRDGADLISLNTLDAALNRGTLTDSQRRQLLDVIDHVRSQIRLAHQGPRRGRPVDPHLMLLVGVVGVLIEKHGIKKDAAVSAMVREDAGTEEERRKRQAVIYRAHTAHKASGETFRASPRFVNAALARINPERNRK